MHGPATGEAANGLPCGRSWHSLTRISQTGAALFGGYDSDGTPLGDCWLLDTAGCKTAIQEPNRDDSLLFATTLSIGIKMYLTEHVGYSDTIGNLEK